MSTRPRQSARHLFASVVVLWASQAAAAGDVWSTRPLAALLDAVRSSGIELSYSSELVPAGLRISSEPAGNTVLEQARSALAMAGLRMRQIAPGRFVVDRMPAPERTARTEGAEAGEFTVPPLDEVLVVGSRDTSVFEAATLSQRQIGRTPAAGSDVLRALRSLPGIAADTSARPYVRGASQEDVLVVYDHVPIPDPFHLNNFQNLSSVFDASVIDRITLYSAGFPVRYGTRAGGVVDIAPHRVAQGHEEIIGAGLTGLRFTSAGHAAQAPVEWLAAARRTTVNPAQADDSSRFGNPVAIDVLARVQWNSGGASTWTLAGLMLDDRIRLRSASGLEDAEARNRDDNLWLTHEYRFSAATQVRTTLVGRHVQRSHSGVATRPGLMSGSLDDSRQMDSLSLYQAWELAPTERVRWNAGIEGTVTSGRAHYRRSVSYETGITPGLGTPLLSPVDNAVSLGSVTYAAFASLVQTLPHGLEYELGLRFDGQDYPSMRRSGEFSPRLDLRYRLSDRIGIYAAVGRYTQAQRPDERRLEDSQFVPDRPQVSWQQSLGVEGRGGRWPDWRVEIYHKHWERVHPYFDNLLNERVLLPELAPYRILVTPSTSVARGAEISLRSDARRVWQYWAAYTWAIVADRIERQSVSRSWDQREALSTGIDVTRGAYSATTALRWHSGLPRTPVGTASTAADGTQMVIGPRNAGRAGDFVSLDLRLAWTRALAVSELELWAELSNALNRANSCCSASNAAAPGSTVLAAGNEGRTPRRLDIGLLWRLH